MSSLECLNMSNCTINSILQGDGDKAPLVKLIFAGATFMNETQAFLHIKTNFLSLLDVSNSSLNQFCFLADMKMIEHLNLCSSIMGDESVELIVCIGANLKNLNLSGTRVSTAGIGILAGHVPKLEILCLSHTSIDDVALSYISLMPALKVIDLSNTNIKGMVSSMQTLNLLLIWINHEYCHIRDSFTVLLSVLLFSSGSDVQRF